MRPPVARGSECEVSRRSDTLAVRNGVREDASAADSGRFRAGIVGFQAPGFLRKSADFRGFSRIFRAARRDEREFGGGDARHDRRAGAAPAAPHSRAEVCQGGEGCTAGSPLAPILT